MDETSTRKGHKYGTVFLEISGKETARGCGASKVARLLFFTPGKDRETFTQFAAELERRGVPAAQVNEIAMDMSKAFIAGAAECFPGRRLCFDRFHVMKLCGESLEAIRKEVAGNMEACHAGRCGRCAAIPKTSRKSSGTCGDDPKIWVSRLLKCAT